ncbi:MAG: aldo/keto reductase [Woeseiaceae bacterium]|nr:aldo/keto reductase [Woeseiaceae bacterium]
MGITRREFSKISLGVATAVTVGMPAMAGPSDFVKRPIPSTGEMIPIIGLGTNRYGVGDGETARAPLRAALKRFSELGGTVIDTAPMYRSSESVLGDLIAELGIRGDLFVATKQDRTSGEETVAQMHESLRRLRTDQVDLMQVHNLLGWRDALPLMRKWKDEGRIRYIGITTSRGSQYGDFEHIMRKEDLDFVQLNYSVEQRQAADRLMPLAADRGMAVMINRAFGGGRIFAAVGDRPVPEWAREFDCATWAQVLLKYALSHPAATVAIPGMTKAHHVDDNMMAGHGRMPDAPERKKIEAFYDAL